MVSPQETKQGFKIFDPRLASNFGTTTTLPKSLKYTNWKHHFKQALFRSLRGKAKLTCENDKVELTNLYPDLEKQANEKGVIGVIK